MSKDRTYDGDLKMNAAIRIHNVFIFFFSQIIIMLHIRVNARGKIKVNLLYEGNRNEDY